MSAQERASEKDLPPSLGEVKVFANPLGALTPKQAQHGAAGKPHAHARLQEINHLETAKGWRP